MDNFDLKKYLVENKLTKQSLQSEGFTDMFSKSKPSETFQGSSQKEFIKWAKSVFDSRKIHSGNIIKTIKRNGTLHGLIWKYKE